MDKIFGDLIPLVGGSYFLLILHGVIQLPMEKQQKFDDYVRNKKTLLFTISYILILVTVASITKKIFFT